MTDRPAETPPPRVPPEPLRRVDWLAAVPWTLLLRVPSACLGWPLVWGALGAILLGWPNANAHVTVLRAANVYEHATEMVARLGNATPLQVAVWPLLGVLICGHAAGPLAGGRAASWRRVLAVWPKRALRVIATACLLLTPAAALIGLLRLFTAGLGLPAIGAALAAVYPLAFWLLAIPAAGLLAIAIVGLPITIAGVCLDDADAFDAASRTVAYTTQRLLRLAWYVLVAAAVAVVAAVVVEGLLSAADTLALRIGLSEFLEGQPIGLSGYHLAGQQNGVLVDGRLIDQTRAIAIRGVRGFYPAYFFTAAAAVYLLLRQDVDGQPLDEVAGGGQSPEA